MNTLTVTPPMLPPPAGREAVIPAMVPLRRVLPLIVIKELRQNLLFFALILVIESVTFCMLQDFVHSYDMMNILLNHSMQNSIAIAASLAGLLLGVFQPLADRNFDIWSFATHRPIGRSVLFYGRVLAGLILYFAGIGVPLIVLFVYAASPSGGAFFIWPFMLPGIAAFVLGIPFYFAGLLVSDRRAKFYGSAAFPLALPVAAGFATSYVPYFLMAVLASVMAAVILFFAARRSMITHGYTLWPKGKPVALFISLLLAFSFVGLPGILIERENLQKKWRKYMEDSFSHQFATTTSYWAQSHFNLMPDGTLAQYIYTSAMKPPGKTTKVEMYTDLQGVPLPTPDEISVSSLSNRTYYCNLVLPQAAEWQDYREPYSYLNPANLVVRYFVTADAHHVTYYYGVRSRGVFYVYDEFRPQVGREEAIRTFLGTVGASGLAKPGERAEPFDVELKIPELATQHEFYSLDKHAHGFKKIFETTGDETIQKWSFGNRNNGSDPLGDEVYIALFTNKRFVLLSRATGAVKVEFPINTHAGATRVSVSSFPVSGHLSEATWWAVDFGIGPDVRSGARILERRDARGALQSTQNFTDSFVRSPSAQTAEIDSFSPRIERRLREIDLRDGVWMGLANPLLELAGASLMPTLYRDNRGNYYYQPRYPVELWNLPHRPWTMLTMGFVLAGSSIGAFLLAGVYRLRRGWLWAILAFVCGPAALLAMVGAFRLPAWRRCAGCGKWRVLSENACGHCGAEWEGTVHTGTEIFG